MNLIDALNEFDQRVQAHLPSSEAGVREVLAQSIRRRMALSISDVEVEASFGAKRHDILIHPTGTAIEIKYHRPTPGGANRPLTVQYGQLLSDVRKLLANPGLTNRVLLLLTDRAGVTHLKNKRLLPSSWDITRVVTADRVLALAKSASVTATSDGPWIDASVRLVWQTEQPTWATRGFAWSVEQAAAG